MLIGKCSHTTGRIIAAASYALEWMGHAGLRGINSRYWSQMRGREEDASEAGCICTRNRNWHVLQPILGPIRPEKRNCGRPGPCPVPYHDRDARSYALGLCPPHTYILTALTAQT